MIPVLRWKLMLARSARGGVPLWRRYVRAVVGRWVFVTPADKLHQLVLNVYRHPDGRLWRIIGIAAYWNGRGVSWVWPVWIAHEERS